MAWEEIKKTMAGRHVRPDVWRSDPCIIIRKSGIVMNALFQSAFGVAVGDSLRVFVDAKNKRVGFKKVDDGADILGYKVFHNATGKDIENCDEAKLNCKSLVDRVEAFHGIYRKAKLNPGERIIEVSLVDSATVDAITP